MNPSRILIVDDHAVVREGLPGLIEDLGSQWEICATAADPEAAIAQALELQPDIVIMDYKMPVADGLATAAEIKRQLPLIEVLIFSETPAPCSLVEIYCSHVGGFMLKCEAVEELQPALEALSRHHPFRSRGVTERYERIAAARAVMQAISAREDEVLRLIIDGKSTKEIAGQIGVSPKTVESHRTHLFRKLGCSSVVELAGFAFRNGLVE
jgi:DNA-binding NarL/FixJ family response regulator